MSSNNLRSKEKKKCVVVLGMHRSGTSAIAGALKILGIDLGSDLMPPTEMNPKGYFENNKVCRLNELILNALGSKWDDMFYFPDKWWDKKEISELREIADNIIANDFKSTGIIGIKDPRLCILLPFWLEVFRELDINPFFIIPVRNPLEVAKSLEKRDNFDDYGFSEEKSLLLWVKYVLDSELFSRGYPRVFINFNEFIASPGMIIEKAFRSLHLHPPKNIKTHEKEIFDFIDPELSHFKYIKKLSGQIDVEFIGELYSLLINNTHINTKVSDFDRIRLEFHKIASLFLNSDLKNEAAIKDKDTHIVNLDGIIKDKDVSLSNLEAVIRDKNAHITNLECSLKKITSSFIYKAGNIIALSLTAIRDYLELVLITIKDSFLFNKNRISKLPEEFGFRGYLDNPGDNENCTISSGWFVSKKPLKRAELFIGDKKITKLERNIRREDVDSAVQGYDNITRKGFEYIIPDLILSALKNKKRTLFIRFYIDGKRYIDNFHTKVRL